MSGSEEFTVVVTPEEFSLVDYEAPAIAEIASTLCSRIGLPAGFALHIEVDETTPLGRTYLKEFEPAVLVVESGAFEHLHRPRQFDADRSADVLGRLLYRLRDRSDPAFGDPPPDDDLSLPVATTWDVYSVGRLGRLGYTVQRARREYQFRVRHSFSDQTDAVFAQLWEADNLTWPDIEQLSAAAVPVPASSG